jgi:hypothetical protein
MTQSGPSKRLIGLSRVGNENCKNLVRELRVRSHPCCAPICHWGGSDWWRIDFEFVRAIWVIDLGSGYLGIISVRQETLKVVDAPVQVAASGRIQPLVALSLSGRFWEKQTLKLHS